MVQMLTNYWYVAILGYAKMNVDSRNVELMRN